MGFCRYFVSISRPTLMRTRSRGQTRGISGVTAARLDRDARNRVWDVRLLEPCGAISSSLSASCSAASASSRCSAFGPQSLRTSLSGGSCVRKGPTAHDSRTRFVPPKDLRSPWPVILLRGLPARPGSLRRFQAASGAGSARDEEEAGGRYVKDIYDLQGLYGSDGTRTRDLRRDRPVRAQPLRLARTPNYRLEQAFRTASTRL